MICRFTQFNVDRAPDAPGVFALFEGNEIIYYGSSEVSIRARLQDHLLGKEGTHTQRASDFACEESNDPLLREAELLREFKQVHGRFPRWNLLFP